MAKARATSTSGTSRSTTRTERPGEGFAMEASLPVEGGSSAADSATASMMAQPHGVETTGRMVVTLKERTLDHQKAVRSMMQDVTGAMAMASSSDFYEGMPALDEIPDASAVHYERLGIVVVSGEANVEALAAAASSADSDILSIEPEYYAYPLVAEREALLAYLRGFRDAATQLCDLVAREGGMAAPASLAALALADTAEATWGLQAIGALTSTFTGKGVRIAVLDTGFDLGHPDFAGRLLVSASFSGVPVQDTNGHGTHCAGTAAGPARPASGVRRYGTAPDADLFVGRVFDASARPKAPTSTVLAGLEWALGKDCHVVSLSLGVPINQKIDQYEVPIRRALSRGTLVVAAAGNNAERPLRSGFVEPPANADSAIAVAAVAPSLGIAPFSARSSQLVGSGGAVNFAGPGVDVFSALPTTRGSHGVLSGTSMAAPHVAGLAALWCQATGLRGQLLWDRLVQTAKPLTALSPADVGAGLVVAP